jgi:hypothetical protein
VGLVRARGLPGRDLAAFGSRGLFRFRLNRDFGLCFRLFGASFRSRRLGPFRNRGNRFLLPAV